MDCGNRGEDREGGCLVTRLRLIRKAGYNATRTLSFDQLGVAMLGRAGRFLAPPGLCDLTS